MTMTITTMSTMMRDILTVTMIMTGSTDIIITEKKSTTITIMTTGITTIMIIITDMIMGIPAAAVAVTTMTMVIMIMLRMRFLRAGLWRRLQL